jgi:hypothetical protein
MVAQETGKSSNDLSMYYRRRALGRVEDRVEDRIGNVGDRKREEMSCWKLFEHQPPIPGCTYMQ